MRVEHRAQPLPGTAFGHDAIEPRRAEQRREARAVGGDFGLPRVPGVAHPRVPGCERFAHVVVRDVERAPERMIGEMDPSALRLEDAGEERREMGAHAGLGQGPGPSTATASCGA